MPSLHDMVLRHRLYLDGLLQSVRSDFNDTAIELDQVVKAAFADIEVKNLGDLNKRQLVEFIRQLLTSSDEVLRQYITDTDKLLKLFVAIERGMYQRIYRSKSDKRVEAATAATMWATIQKSDIAASGSTFEQHEATFHDAALIQIEKAVRRGYADKVDTADVLTAIRGQASHKFRDGVFEQLNKWSGGMTGVLFTHSSAKVNHDVAESAFDQYQWISIIDDVTTDICFDRNLEIYTYGEGPIPPAHYGCRSDIVPFVDGESPPTDFASWLDTQPGNLLGDIFSGGSTRLENIKPITLDQFKSKLELIMS